MSVKSVTVTINGQEYPLTLNSSTGKYEATITAPSQTSGMNNSGQGPGVGSNASGKGYYPVRITAVDDAGNSTTIDDTHATFGNSCKLKVKETVAPVGSFTYPSASATITSNKPTIKFKFTDSGSGVNPSSCKAKVDSESESAVTLSGSGSELTGTFTPSSALADGSHTVTVYAYDYDGNKSNSATVTFTIDTTPPTLNVTAPAQGLITNSTKVTVTGTTNDAISSPVTVTVKVNSGSAESVTVGSDGSFSKEVTLASGSNTITVTSTDAAGKSTTITRTVVVDTGAPVFGSVDITPNPTNTGVSYTISVEVTD